MKLSFLIILFSLASVVVSGQSENRIDMPNTKDVTEFCDLIRDASKHVGREVKVRATYRYAFEHSEIYCLGCTDDRVWVEFDSSFKKRTKYKLRERIGDNGFQGRTVNVVAIGKLITGEGYGHFGVYPFKFVISSLVEAEIVSQKGTAIEALEPTEKAKVCDGRNH